MRKIFRRLAERYLKYLTKTVIQKNRPLIVIVAGTANKTFIKKRISEKLQEYDVRGNPRSFDSRIGLPLAVLFLPSGRSSVFRWIDILFSGTFISLFRRNFPKVLILEIRIKKKGDMKHLLSMIKPHIVIISNINRNFPDSRDDFDFQMRETGYLVKAVRNNGSLILNADDRRAVLFEKLTKAKKVLFGRVKEADVKISNTRQNQSGQSFDLLINGNKEHIQVDLYGKHNVDAEVVSRIVEKEVKKMIKK